MIKKFFLSCAFYCYFSVILVKQQQKAISAHPLEVYTFWKKKKSLNNNSYTLVHDLIMW